MYDSIPPKISQKKNKDHFFGIALITSEKLRCNMSLTPLGGFPVQLPTPDV